MTEPGQNPPAPGYHDPATAVTDPQKEPKFSAAEIQEFAHADRNAGAAVVLLMAGVFSVGLVMYTIIALTFKHW